MITDEEYEELLENRKRLQKKINAFDPPAPRSLYELEDAKEAVAKHNALVDQINEEAELIEQYRAEMNRQIDNFNQLGK